MGDMMQARLKNVQDPQLSEPEKELTRSRSIVDLARSKGESSDSVQSQSQQSTSSKPEGEGGETDTIVIAPKKDPQAA